LLNRAYFRVQRKELDQAAADYRQAIQLKKDFYLAHADLAGVYLRQGKPAEALEQFTQAIALKPDFAPLYRDRAGLRMSLGYATQEQRDAARADLDMAIRYEDKSNRVLAQDHTNRGNLLYLDRRPEDALEECKLALQVFPDYVDAHILRIKALLNLRRFDEALRSCDVALTKGKKLAVLYEYRGDVHSRREKYADAIRDYSRAIELRGDDPGLYARRGWAYAVFDAPGPALADFESALRLDPSNGDAYNGRGTARVLRGDHIGGVADAREALKRAKADPLVTYHAARVYALAASRAAAEVGGVNGRQSRILSSRYQDNAVRFVREAIGLEAPEKRAGFWRDVIQKDPALKAIQPRLKFDDLIATTKPPNS
jgi:tetratricopeptide (TPR) repeat protein